ncbi:MAG: electron transfer flavoprotein beta subunit/FixA family protein [Chrysiogenales bacterium]|nr:MAG: electron transfer flavoprotein beta subunit/FixA family protein [Chrysiogenales bacterium]
MLSLIVCIKQVPDAHKVRISGRNGDIDRAGADNILNPDDLHAIETALSLRDAYGGRITALTMGPPQAADVLYEAYALGVDDCVLVSDPAFAGSDTLATSRVLSRAVTLLAPFDIIVTGREAIDGNTGHVGYQLSEFLSVPLITRIHDIRIESSHAVIERTYGHEHQNIRVSLPVLLSIGRNENRVRTPRLADISLSADRGITRFGLDDIGGSAAEYGGAGSPTIVIDTEIFTHVRGRETLAGSLDEKVDQLIHRLKKDDVLRN